MKRWYMLVLLFIASLGIGLAIASPANAAYDPNSGVDCSGAAKSSAFCSSKTDGNNPISSDNGVLHSIANIVAYAAGVAAIVVIILSGIKYITAGGDANKVGSAKSTLIGAIVGLLVIASAYILINYVVSSTS